MRSRLLGQLGVWGVLLAVRLVLLLPGAFALAASEERVAVRIEVRDAKGRPARVTLQLVEKGGDDRQRVESNEYGLAFASLRAGANYRVTAGGFENFTSISVPRWAPNGYGVQLQLPASRMRGKMAGEGRGLVLFTYVDAEGKPKAGAELRCVDGSGGVYTGRTNAQGVARVEVPLDMAYRFSVDGYPNFESHTFTKVPLLQTTEIRLEETRKKSSAMPASVRPSVPRKYSVYESSLQKGAPTMHTRQDSIAGAKRTVRDAVRTGRRAQYATPPRGVKPSPKVTKQVMNGVYLLRQALIEEERENPKEALRRLPVLPPLTRNGWDSMVLVIDVTCSMDPYVEEYLLWTTLARNGQRLVGCVFFNDGDGLADSLKMLGAAGGVRHATPRLQDMVDTLVKCVSYGCSGSSDENDVEALLYAQQQYPYAKSFVLIADNTSAVRDLILADGILKPVHVLLCDPHPSPVPNPDYVTIAYLTRGSVHLLSEDFNLAKQSGDKHILRLGKWEYQYVRDRWTRRE